MRLVWSGRRHIICGMTLPESSLLVRIITMY
jgi:hypothetical protein